jgi:hypothetical protein
MDSSNPPSGSSSSETNHRKMLKLHNLHRHLERLYRARPVNEEDSDNNNNERFIEDGDISQEKKVQLPCLPRDDEELMKDTSVNNPVLPFHPSLPLLFGVTPENDESERPIRM